MNNVCLLKERIGWVFLGIGIILLIVGIFMIINLLLK